VLVARDSDDTNATPYELGPAREVEVVPVRGYRDLRHVASFLLALPSTLAGFWRALSRVDAIWISGVHPVAPLLIALALVRRREVVILARMDADRYFRSRLPGPLWFPLLIPIWLAERAVRLFARRLKTTVVGRELAERYGGPRPNLLEMRVALTSEREVAAAPIDRGWDGEIRLLAVGRLEPEKNPALAIEMLKRLQASRPDGYRLTWAGEGRLREELAERARAEGVDGSLDLPGFVPHGPELEALYRSADALVHIALTEGLPQVLLEAMAAGLPIVATDVGGVRDGLDDGRAGLLVPPDDAAALVDALESLRQDPALRRRIAERALELSRATTLEAEGERVARFIVARAR
jgi:glycosyltransferase involved in cell wall biosynthesis